MAVYKDLCVDCGSDESLSDVILAHFEKFQIELLNIEPVEMRAFKCFARQRWHVTVLPIGLGHGIPGDKDRVEIQNDATEQIIGSKLLDHLSEIAGFRRATFGVERSYFLVDQGEENDQGIDLVGMIFSIDEFGENPPGVVVEDFSYGLKRVTKIIANLGAKSSI